ncbi:MAG: hypothetical protein Q4D98_10100 [Planctomycetia bacterium]|nr:hypothetical protein [Planctomycetia bacterium]
MSNPPKDPGSVLPREEYIEQAYLFKVLRERMHETATQELMITVQHEILATTRLPMAMEYMASTLKHTGSMADAMAGMPHYFTPFQTFVMSEAERDDGKFDFQIALLLLEREAKCRADALPPQALFLYQFEAISRNRLHYDRGLKAVAGDPVFDDEWRQWILWVRRQLGVIDVAELIYVRSAYYPIVRRQDPGKPFLFGEKEGRIALANRRKDPMYLFSALQRHLNYPEVPRRLPGDSREVILEKLMRSMERLESRMKFVEEEVHGGIDITRYYVKGD